MRPVVEFLIVAVVAWFLGGLLVALAIGAALKDAEPGCSHPSHVEEVCK